MDPQDSIQWAIQYPQIIQNLQMLLQKKKTGKKEEELSTNKFKRKLQEFKKKSIKRLQGLVKGLSDLDFIELIKL